MANIVVIGGTGYAGSHIAREAVNRGHDVTVIARSTPDAAIDGVRYVLAVTTIGTRAEIELTKRVPGVGYVRDRKVPSTGKFATRHAAIRQALESAP